MSRAFGGSLFVHYGQAYVLPNGSSGIDLDDSYRGQSNGLLGASVPGSLFLITGLHTGYVNFTLDILDSPPPIDDSWEEIVEAPFVVSAPVALEQWAGEKRVPLALAPGSYRARYCARNMGLGEEGDPDNASASVESYLLQLWPSAPAPDAIIRQTSEAAKYWHETARKLSAKT